MIIVGQISSKEEASELNFIAKLFAVGMRSRFLGKQGRKLNDKTKK